MKKFLGIILFFIFIILIFFLITFKQNIKIKLYFYDPKTLKLIPEERILTVSIWANFFRKENITRDVILNLIKGPMNQRLLSTVPSGVKLLQISIKNQIAYVNFSKELKKSHPGGSMGEMLTVYSIVNTLTELSWIKKVQILIEGAVIESLAGHIDISEPLERDLSLIK